MPSCPLEPFPHAKSAPPSEITTVWLYLTHGEKRGISSEWRNVSDGKGGVASRCPGCTRSGAARALAVDGCRSATDPCALETGKWARLSRRETHAGRAQLHPHAANVMRCPPSDRTTDGVK